MILIQKQYDSSAKAVSSIDETLNKAYQAVLLLDDPNNFKQITGTQREELSKKLQTKALFQSKRIELANNSRINDSDKALIQELTGANNAPLGLDEEKLESFKTGDIEYDNQIKKHSI